MEAADAENIVVDELEDEVVEIVAAKKRHRGARKRVNVGVLASPRPPELVDHSNEPGGQEARP